MKKEKKKEKGWKVFWKMAGLWFLALVFVVCATFLASVVDLRESGQGIEICISIERR